MRIVVLGIGNILLTDEGVGVRAVESLEQRYALPPEVEVVDGGTTGMELLDLIADVDHLIIVDAVRVDQPPATIVRLEGDEIPAMLKTKISPHQLGLSDLLAMLTLSDELPGHLVLIGVQPVSLATGMDLSPAVAEKLDAIVGLVCDELRAIGVAPAEREAA